MLSHVKFINNMEFFSIGVYNSTQEEFFNKLIDNKIDTFCDIRQRRGVRGAKYSFVNSNRLQQKLNALGIKYVYVSDLAPTTEIRDLQKKIDLQKSELKTTRLELGKTFIIEYKNKILGNFNFEDFINNLKQIEANRIVLFCVEENPVACHRSVVINTLSSDYNYKVTHL